ncbi:hypothetical protein HJ590_13335 [Naumannella sp. ID2617S]|nr:hypothetical protein [Naumannella sp. ID2617S]
MRVFTVSLRHGRERGNQPWVNESGSELVHLGHCAQLLKGRLLGVPIKMQEAEAFTNLPEVKKIEARKRYLRVQDFQRHDRRLSLVVKYGMGSDYSYNMGPGGDVAIDQQAPAREYRIELLTPKKDGVALMAVETIARVCPEAAISAWLGAASKLIKPQGSPWKRLITAQAVDPDYLADLVKNAKEVEVRLKHVGPDEVGNRSRTLYRLQGAIHHNRRGKAINWARQQRRGLDGMLEVLGVADDGDFDFNDGYMSIDDGDAKTRVGLTGAKEAFTYPLADDAPEDDEWINFVQRRFKQLHSGLEWV